LSGVVGFKAITKKKEVIVGMSVGTNVDPVVSKYYDIANQRADSFVDDEISSQVVEQEMTQEDADLLLNAQQQEEYQGGGVRSYVSNFLRHHCNCSHGWNSLPFLARLSFLVVFTGTFNFFLTILIVNMIKKC
jgi:hypothetical protein